METLLTLSDIEEAGAVVDKLLEMFIEQDIPPSRAAAALAVALGHICQQFRISLVTAGVLLEESYRLSEQLDQESRDTTSSDPPTPGATDHARVGVDVVRELSEQPTESIPSRQG